MGEKNKKLTLLLDEELYRKFKAMSEESRMSMASIMRQWIINAPNPKNKDSEKGD